VDAPGFVSAINGAEVEDAECGRNGLVCLVGIVNNSGESPMPISRLDMASVSKQEKVEKPRRKSKCERHQLLLDRGHDGGLSDLDLLAEDEAAYETILVNKKDFCVRSQAAL
jgi:hypothetical protein